MEVEEYYSGFRPPLYCQLIFVFQLGSLSQFKSDTATRRDEAHS
jgi:hypothetical protein